MIRILDPATQRTAAKGAVILDRAEVMEARLSFRKGREGDPCIVGNAIFGVEDAGGEFQPLSYEDPQFLLYFKIRQEDIDEFCSRPYTISRQPVNGWGMFEINEDWLEQMLVAEGLFGAGAEVVYAEASLVRADLLARMAAKLAANPPIVHPPVRPPDPPSPPLGNVKAPG